MAWNCWVTVAIEREPADREDGDDRQHRHQRADEPRRRNPPGLAQMLDQAVVAGAPTGHSRFAPPGEVLAGTLFQQPDLAVVARGARMVGQLGRIAGHLVDRELRRATGWMERMRSWCCASALTNL